MNNNFTTSEREFINNVRRFIKKFPVEESYSIAIAEDAFYESWFIFKYNLAANKRRVDLSLYIDCHNVLLISKEDVKKKKIDIKKCMDFLNISVPIQDGHKTDPSWPEIIIEIGAYPPYKAFDMIETMKSTVTFNECEQNFIASLKDLIEYTKTINWPAEAKDTEHLELVMNHEFYTDLSKNGWYPYLRNAFFVYPVIDNGPFITFAEACKCEIDVHKCLDYLGITRCSIDDGDLDELLA